jgi:TRAP transporter TAXI family solute receptor
MDTEQLLRRLAGVGHAPRRATLAIGATVLLAAGCGQPVPEHPRTRLRFTSGTPGAGFYPLGQGLARGFERLLPGLDVEVHESEGSVSNVDAIQRGVADLGLSYADVAYVAFVGQLEGRSRFDHLRGIAVLHRTPLHVVVRRGSSIRSIGDLRGQRVGTGFSGSGSALTASLLLKAFGLGVHDVRTESLRYNEAAARLVTGDLDALLVVGGEPLEAVTVATAAGARILPLEGPAIEHLLRADPFFIRASIAKGVYPGHSRAIHTIGVDNLLVCRDDLNEQLVHDLAQRLFEILPDLQGPHAAAGALDLERAPATPIPLHPGAARYYREREISR